MINTIERKTKSLPVTRKNLANLMDIFAKTCGKEGAATCTFCRDKGKPSCPNGK